MLSTFGSKARALFCARNHKPRQAAQLKGNSVKNADKNSQDQVIDENLKKVFDETLEEGIPDRFKMLLSQLKQQDNERGSSK